jgi:hypothetical protein
MNFYTLVSAQWSSKILSFSPRQGGRVGTTVDVGSTSAGAEPTSQFWLRLKSKILNLDALITSD